MSETPEGGESEHLAQQLSSAHASPRASIPAPIPPSPVQTLTPSSAPAPEHVALSSSNHAPSLKRPSEESMAEDPDAKRPRVMGPGLANGTGTSSASIPTPPNPSPPAPTPSLPSPSPPIPTPQAPTPPVPTPPTAISPAPVPPAPAPEIPTAHSQYASPTEPHSVNTSVAVPVVHARTILPAPVQANSPATAPLQTSQAPPALTAAAQPSAMAQTALPQAVPQSQPTLPSQANGTPSHAVPSQAEGPIQATVLAQAPVQQQAAGASLSYSVPAQAQVQQQALGVSLTSSVTPSQPTVPSQVSVSASHIVPSQAERPIQGTVLAQAPVQQQAASASLAPVHQNAGALEETKLRQTVLADGNNGTVAGTSSLGTSPENDTANLPVVEATAARDANEKPKRVVVDGSLDAEQRSLKVQDERKKICPKAALDQILARLGKEGEFECDESVQVAITHMAEGMLEHAMEFAALMSSSRRSNWLEGKDLELYLDRTWSIHLPGYGDRSVHPAPKVHTESANFQRSAAVRQALLNMKPAPAAAPEVHPPKVEQGPSSTGEALPLGNSPGEGDDDMATEAL